MRWIRNENSNITEPLRKKGLVQAGSTHQIAKGDLCERTAVFETDLAFVKIDSAADFAGELAICDEDVVAGDLPGFRWFVIPRPGDVFEADLDDTAALAMGALLYFVDAKTLTPTAGANALGAACDDGHYPQTQDSVLGGSGASDKGGFADIAEKDTVLFMFKASRSFFAKLQT